MVGDQDGFDPVWVPRLHAAGADLDLVRTLDDGEFLDDFAARADALREAIRRERFALVIFDALLDHIPGGKDGSAVYNPKAVRQALLPLRRVIGQEGVAALGLLHPVKGGASSFRQLAAASHQFNAVSRSSLLLAVDPDDPTRRVLARWKGNHSAAPRTFEFSVVAEGFELAGRAFEMPKVAAAREGDRTVDELLQTPDAPVREELTGRLADALTDDVRPLAALARAVGRKPKDGSVRNALHALAAQGRAEQVITGKPRGWRRTGIPGLSSGSKGAVQGALGTLHLAPWPPPAETPARRRTPRSPHDRRCRTLHAGSRWPSRSAPSASAYPTRSATRSTNRRTDDHDDTNPEALALLQAIAERLGAEVVVLDDEHEDDDAAVAQAVTQPVVP